MVFRLDVASASATAPAAGTPGTEGFPADTAIIDPYWLYALCEEIRNVVVAAGLTPTKGNVAQLLASLKQAGPPVGSLRNASMIIATASATATFTADEIVVAQALGGFTWKLGSFSQAINLATTGAGGMDTGTAPVSGYVALYAIYNPITNKAALLATNVTSALAPSIYGGANLPSGYTYSALVSVWATNTSGQFKPGFQVDRQIAIAYSSALAIAFTEASPSVLSLSAIVPMNARKVSGTIGINSSAAALGATFTLFSTLTSLGGQLFNLDLSSGGSGGFTAPFANLAILTPQVIYYTCSNTSGTPGFYVAISGYEI